MKSFKNYILEQHIGKEETTLSPDFLEKKEKRDRQAEKRLEEPTQEVDNEAEQEG